MGREGAGAVAPKKMPGRKQGELLADASLRAGMQALQKRLGKIEKDLSGSSSDASAECSPPRKPKGQTPEAVHREALEALKAAKPELAQQCDQLFEVVVPPRKPHDEVHSLLARTSRARKRLDQAADDKLQCEDELQKATEKVQEAAAELNEALEAQNKALAAHATQPGGAAVAEPPEGPLDLARLLEEGAGGFCIEIPGHPGEAADGLAGEAKTKFDQAVRKAQETARSLATALSPCLETFKVLVKENSALEKGVKKRRTEGPGAEDATMQEEEGRPQQGSAPGAAAAGDGASTGTASAAGSQGRVPSAAERNLAEQAIQRAKLRATEAEARARAVAVGRAAEHGQRFQEDEQEASGDAGPPWQRH